MTDQPLYSLQKMPLGWTVASSKGVSMSALSECLEMLKGCSTKGEFYVHPGIAHHLKYYSGLRNVVFVIATRDNAKIWEEQIAKKLSSCNPEGQWFYGTDVGRSSAAIFAVFCDPSFMTEPEQFSQKAWPIDCDDFGRCERLLAIFPDLRGRLNEVAEAYPDTKWPKLIARWDEIEKADPVGRDTIISECIYWQP